jgi:hypothetical protein
MESRAIEAVLQNRHDRVVEILYNLCKTRGPYKAVYADHIGVPARSIQIHSPRGGGELKGHSFMPDVWGRLPNGKVDVLEVWDEQSEAGGVQNLLWTALTPHLNSMAIVCFDQKSVEHAKELTRLILSSIFNGKGEPFVDPEEVARRIIVIPKKSHNDDLAIRALLELKFRPLWD